jgi:hypothetical protein
MLECEKSLSHAMSMECVKNQEDHQCLKEKAFYFVDFLKKVPLS